MAPHGPITVGDALVSGVLAVPGKATFTYVRERRSWQTCRGKLMWCWRFQFAQNNIISTLCTICTALVIGTFWLNIGESSRIVCDGCWRKVQMHSGHLFDTTPLPLWTMTLPPRSGLVQVNWSNPHTWGLGCVKL